VVDEREQRLGVGGEAARLGASRLGDSPEHPLGLIEPEPAGIGEGSQALAIVVNDAEQLADIGVADGERRGEGQDPVSNVLFAAASERLEASLIGDVVAAVVEHT
jgi:hypothetical protein